MRTALDILVEDLVGYLDAIDVPHCHLLGHSMGGMVAMRFALRHPRRLKSLILMDTAAEPLTVFPQALREQLAKDVRANGCAGRIKMMRDMPMSEAAARGRDYLGEDEHWRRIELKLSQMDPEAWVALGNDMSNQTRRTRRTSGHRHSDNRHRRRTRRPLCGTVSANGEDNSQRAPLVTIPLAAHCPQYENAAVWRDAIDAHLTARRAENQRHEPFVREVESAVRPREHRDDRQACPAESAFKRTSCTAPAEGAICCATCLCRRMRAAIAPRFC